MSRTPLILLIVMGALLGGCIGAPFGETPTTEPPNTVSATETREGCRELDRRALPEVPKEFTRRTAVQFVKTYRNATLWNDVFGAGEPAQKAHVSVTGYLVSQTATGYVVHVRSSGGGKLCGTFGLYFVDLGIRADDYFVNESMLALVNSPVHFPEEVSEHYSVAKKVHQQNWTVLERWNGRSD